MFVRGGHGLNATDIDFGKSFNMLEDGIQIVSYNFSFIWPQSQLRKCSYMTDLLNTQWFSLAHGVEGYPVLVCLLNPESVRVALATQRMGTSGEANEEHGHKVFIEKGL